MSSRTPSLNRITTQKRGRTLIQDPLLNKGSAFSMQERDDFGLHGLLPPRISSIQNQIDRAKKSLDAAGEPLDKYVNFAALQDRNEHLFYRVLMDNMAELLPIVYTPTVGLATQNFSRVFQRARGVWINPSMRSNIVEVLGNAVGGRTIRLIVATDNESILGIGDQGAGGMAISVGKLALYVAGAGIPPGETLPISLDIGTNNETLLKDELYLGWRENRISGAEYQAFIDEFVDAVRVICPEALLQWEDFRKDNALTILNRHRERILSFNDDIQGTGAVALAGIFSALKITKQSLVEQRIVIYGAGAAGMGIANQIRAAMRSNNMSEADVDNAVAVLDSKGLLVDDRPFQDAYKADLAWTKKQADEYGLGEIDHRKLDGVVKQYKPTVLIGTSGQAGMFTESIVRNILAYCERPIIMPFSNPTDRSEATPQDLMQWTDGRALVATGSPFSPVSYNGKVFKIGQGNNVFIFPGLGLGTLLSNSTVVTDDMVTAAANACANTLTDDELTQGMLYPDVVRLREVSKQIAQAVADQAVNDGTANTTSTEVAKQLEHGLWDPSYPELHAG